MLRMVGLQTLTIGEGARNTDTLNISWNTLAPLSRDGWKGGGLQLS